MQQGDGAAPERGASALLLASLFPRAGLLRFHTPLLCPACREEGGGRCHVSLACSSLLPFQLLPVGHLQLVVWLLLLLPFSAENKKDVDTIHEFLLVKGVEAVAVHGSKDQEEREWAISSFKAGGWVGGWTGGQVAPAAGLSAAGGAALLWLDTPTQPTRAVCCTKGKGKR